MAENWIGLKGQLFVKRELRRTLVSLLNREIDRKSFIFIPEFTKRLQVYRYKFLLFKLEVNNFSIVQLIMNLLF